MTADFADAKPWWKMINIDYMWIYATNPHWLIRLSFYSISVTAGTRKSAIPSMRIALSDPFHRAVPFVTLRSSVRHKDICGLASL